MKKKVVSFVLSLVAVLSVCTVMASAKCYFLRFTDDTGNIMYFSENMPNLGGEIFLAQGEKSFVGRQYSRVYLYNKNDGIRRGYFWVKKGNSNMSRAFEVLPGENIEIPYYSSNAFNYKENVILMGKQNNVLKYPTEGEFHVN